MYVSPLVVALRTPAVGVAPAPLPGMAFANVQFPRLTVPKPLRVPALPPAAERPTAATQAGAASPARCGASLCT